MSIVKDEVSAHAAECRAARYRGEARPGWKSGSLRGVDLGGADLTDAVLCESDMTDASLCRAFLCGADLRRASLRGVLLEGADLGHADLRDADLRDADLRDADLRDADLRDANLRGADLSGAKLPDGRTLAEWQADPLAGLCDDPESVARALAAWGGRTWRDCPLHAALGANSLDDVPEDRRTLAATFVALLDGGHLPRPGTRPGRADA